MLKKKKDYNPNEPVRWDVVGALDDATVTFHCYSLIAAQAQKADLEELNPGYVVEIREVM
jgi:hypothetical protein